MKTTGNSLLAALIYKGKKKVLKFEDCMIEHSLTLKNDEERYKLFFENVDFFNRNLFTEKAKYYCQLVFESSTDPEMRKKAKCKLLEIHLNLKNQYEQ